MSSLVRSHAYLDEHRGMIVGRALASGIAGALPIPMLEEWLASTIHRGTIRKIAEAEGVDLDEGAVRAIADGPARPPEWTEIAGGGLLARLLSRAWRRVVIALLVARRAQAASRIFVLDTLFNHYCSKVHVGLGLNAASGAELRALMNEAIKQTEGGVSRRMFRRGVLGALRSTLRAPMDMANLLSGGALRRLLTRGDEVQAVEEVEATLESELSEQGFLARATAAIELELSAEGNPYVTDVIETFERLWRDHEAARTP